MNRRVRRALLIVASVIFIVATPLIILYALGFRLTSERVGVLFLDSTPSRAQVFINEELIGITPRTVSGLGGTSVKISVRKAGYIPWEKQLPFATGATSEVSSILLLPEEFPLRTLAHRVSQFSLAPNRNLVAVVGASDLTVYDENQRVIVEKHALPAAPKSLLWSPDSTFILISYSERRRDVLSLQDGTLHSLPPFVLAKPEAATWDPRLPGRLLFLSTEKELFAVTVSEKTSQPLASDVVAFALGTRDIVVATSRELARVSLQGLRDGATVLTLPKPVKTVLVSSVGRVAVQFQDGSISLWEGGQLTKISDDAQALGFSPSGELLYVQTALHELVVTNIGDERLVHLPLQRPYLVTRVSAPITHPQWFAGGQHLIYQLGDQIMLTEIDTRDHAITRQIDSTNMSNAELAVGEDGKSLFYLKRSPEGVISLVRTDLIIP